MFAIPYIFIMIVIVISGQIADRLRARKIMSTTAVRKLQTLIGFNFYLFFCKIRFIENRWCWFIRIFDTHWLCWM